MATKITRERGLANPKGARLKRWSRTYRGGPKAEMTSVKVVNGEVQKSGWEKITQVKAKEKWSKCAQKAHVFR